jgi:hypothetical protein
VLEPFLLQGCFGTRGPGLPHGCSRGLPSADSQANRASEVASFRTFEFTNILVDCRDALKRGDQDFRIAALEAYRLQTSQVIDLFRDCKQRLDLHNAHARAAKQSDTKGASQQVFERHLATHDSTLEPVLSSRQQRSRGRVSETPVRVESQSGRQNRAAELSTSRSNSSSLASSSNTRSPTHDEDAGNESQGGGSKVPDRPYSDKLIKPLPDKDPFEKASGERPPSNKAPLLETAAERQVREACEALSSLLEKRIAESVPEFRLSVDSDGMSEKEGSSATGVNAGHASAVASSPGWRDDGPDFRGDSPWSSAQQSYPPQETVNSSDVLSAVTYLEIDLPLGGPIRDVLGDLPADVVDRLLDLLRAPQELLKALASCSRGAAEALREETERIDIRGDAEKLRQALFSGPALSIVSLGSNRSFSISAFKR